MTRRGRPTWAPPPASPGAVIFYDNWQALRSPPWPQSRKPHTSPTAGTGGREGQECVCMCECAPGCPRVCKEWTPGCRASRGAGGSHRPRGQNARRVVESLAGDSKLQRWEGKAHDSMSCLNTELLNAGTKRHLCSGGQRLLQRAQMRRALWLFPLYGLMPQLPAGRSKRDGADVPRKGLSGAGVQAGPSRGRPLRRRQPASPPASGASGTARRPARPAAGPSRPGPSAPPASASGP